MAWRAACLLRSAPASSVFLTASVGGSYFTLPLAVLSCVTSADLRVLLLSASGCSRDETPKAGKGDPAPHEEDPMKRSHLPNIYRDHAAPHWQV
ncbi:hypothetical protein NDU88_003675 [Pleurodeles waltl]|uniref:Secreted protein n=1 Tax=Pleurodeles waltl TaxID=8319 RepID=A0AAV7VEV4_PLEWA|nr:hypothetical protein NDU88_003675 [Pleurodeles waltl]